MVASSSLVRACSMVISGCSLSGRSDQSTPCIIGLQLSVLYQCIEIWRTLPNPGAQCMLFWINLKGTRVSLFENQIWGPVLKSVQMKFGGHSSRR